ncbi:DUF3536 domain-containing protein [Anaeromyxobacter paludicola]|uniref:Glycoside hydrolase n=1 Tax=Anaeromyxobacter paludicola TaxID=2918171 RepID=A0ABM7XA47_9BACT|nr:DUF3536 domain-containing protein [Anaeromyxobacter paludicola]BDG08721.1 glycoside hydrolase [Anaeromyxobacter paludicola]
MPRRLLCLHGHFYQPPRENPWIDEIEVQDSADPFHDWNERIATECYGPNAAARIKDGAGRIVDIVSGYRHLSFNFGPTLLAWLERHRPDVYGRVLEADAWSLERTGHGNALAQAYHHAILPLCSPRDRRTEIRWGLADFQRRFHRAPEGFWLPETAADSPTLAALAAEGIRFTLLSPYQVRRIRLDEGDWRDATEARFDPSRPYRVRAGDRELAVFFYDGHIARDLAFGQALSTPEALLSRLEDGYDDTRGHDEILTVAIDGETLGHHKKGADEVLAAALRRLAAKGEPRIVNLGQALELVPVRWEAEIAEGSSWSCAHGLERWRSDCGCNAGGEPAWNQAWRAPLRSALDGLRDRCAALYERASAGLLADPWRARDRYVELVLDPERRDVERFFRVEAARPLAREERVRALRLLEMERQALRMYTSCGWFFSELSGLETVQVLKYAARAIQLAREAAGEDLEPEFAEALGRAPSNVPALRDGRRVYEQLVRPSVASLERVAAHLAIAGLVQPLPDSGRLFCYRYRVRGRRVGRAGAATLALGRLELESLATGERLDALVCVMHFGAADFRCGVEPWPGEAAQAAVEEALFARGEAASLPELLRAVDRAFGGRDYTLRDLFLDERRRVAEILLADSMRRYEYDFTRIFEDNRRLMEFLRELDSPVPGPLRAAADVSLSRRLSSLTRRIGAGEVALRDGEPELRGTVELARRLGVGLHLDPVRRQVLEVVEARMADVAAGRGAAARAAELVEVLSLASRLGLTLDLWAAQNRLWDWAGANGAALDRDSLAALGRELWFDEETLLARAGYAPLAPEAIA